MILAGGVAGGVLLTPGTAFAADPAATTTTTITSVVQTSNAPPIGTTLTVTATVTSTAGTPTGTIEITGVDGGCTFVAAPSGSCTFDNVSPGTYFLTATFVSSSPNFAGSTSFPYRVVVGGGPGPVHNAPFFTVDNPPGYATPGQFYSYTFHAVGSPPIHYSISGGWLSINPNTGTVFGRVPNFGTTSSFVVTASNFFGSTHRYFTVHIQQPFHQRHHYNANISTSLSCTSKVFSGQKGSCTLSVTDHSGNSATNVNAKIALPSQLQANYCGFFGNGCSIFNNTASENLGTLFSGQTKTLTVHFTARTASFLWGNNHRFSLRVKVTGSATSNGGNGFFGQSTSTAYVTIVPRFV